MIFILDGGVYIKATKRWGPISGVQTGQPEKVFAQDNFLEGLVAEEHVDGAGVGQLTAVVGLVLEAAAGRVLELTESGIFGGGTHGGNKVCAGNESVTVVVQHVQIHCHCIGRSANGVLKI